MKRRAILLDTKGKADTSFRVPKKGDSSQRAKSFAWSSRCRSRISFTVSLYKGALSCGERKCHQ